VYPTNVFRFLLTAGATSFILAHNHPGGSSHASEADWKLTEGLKKAGELPDPPLLDHILITDAACISLRDCGGWGRN
jgi:DNA repair protein RadC